MKTATKVYPLECFAVYGSRPALIMHLLPLQLAEYKMLLAIPFILFSNTQGC